MHWLNLALQMVIPVGVTIYTVNFGRWMAGKGNRPGAYGAYALAIIALVLSAVSLFRNNA